MNKRERDTPPMCPCGGARPYADCCAPLHAGAPAASAEALMRSRYCAYVLRREDYLLATWHASTRPARLGLADESPPPRWLGLEVGHCAEEDADHAVVDFVARCKYAGRAQRLHEISEFVREDGRWFYLRAR